MAGCLSGTQQRDYQAPVSSGTVCTLGQSAAELDRLSPEGLLMPAPRVLRRPLRESEEKAAGLRLLKAVGAKVWHLAQNRASRQTPGLGDCWIVLPQGHACWWECKATNGKQTQQQLEFQRFTVGAGVPVIVGGAEAVRDHLRRIGILA